MMKEQNSYIFTKEVKSLDAFAVGQRIQDARICKGIKAIDLAEMLELSKDQYSRIENGRSLCNTKKLYLISQYLDASADYILTGNKSEDILHQLSAVMEGRSEKDLERARRVLEAVFM